MKLLHHLKYFNVGSIKLKRFPYKALDNNDIEYFRTFLKPSQIITDNVEL